MSIFVHQGSQKTPGSSTTTNEHTHVPSLLRSPPWQPDFCLMHTSDMLLVLYKATDALKSHTSVLAPALTPKGKSNQRGTIAVLLSVEGLSPSHHFQRVPCNKTRMENNKHAQGSGIPMETLQWISCGKLFMSQAPIHRPPWLMTAERQQLGLMENGSCDIWGFSETDVFS